ncbi:MAG: aminoacyl-tRNA hydrolase [Armatimonadota bacterium]
MTYCVLGIGNPGSEYAHTKHNIGWWVVDELARRHDIALKRERLRARYGRGRVKSVDVVLAQPLTYVNASGDAALRLAVFFRIRPANFIIVLDDMNLEPGAVRLRPGGSDGGHRGLRSIIEVFGTTEVPRLRVGIGSPPEGKRAVEWVLSPFAEDVRPVVDEAITRAADCIEVALTQGLPTAMSQFNG